MSDVLVPIRADPPLKQGNIASARSIKDGLSEPGKLWIVRTVSHQKAAVVND